MIALLPLFLAAAPIAGGDLPARPQVARLATASVTIIRAERIGPSVADSNRADSDREVRQRDHRPLIEFF
jgi:hypothetical protein